VKKNYAPTGADLGFPQQIAIFEEVRRLTGRTPVVVDAEDILRDPEGMLRRLCEAVGVAFSETMLSWPPGRRQSDGVWAKYWYGEVETSTGFARPHDTVPQLPADFRGVHEECRVCYEKLHGLRLT
jgi:hypothetical protein